MGVTSLHCILETFWCQNLNQDLRCVRVIIMQVTDLNSVLFMLKHDVEDQNFTSIDDVERKILLRTLHFRTRVFVPKGAY